MPYSPTKQSVANGNRNRYTRGHAHSSGMLLLIILLLHSSVQDLFEVPGELPFICPEGPKKAKCTCTQVEVNCTDVGLLAVPLGLSTNLQSLILRKNLLSSIDSIISLPSSLVYIILRKNLISSIDSIMSLPPSLVYIDTSFNSITSIDWSLFATLTNLEELHLQMNFISWIDLSYYYGTKLRVLNLSGNQLVDIVDEGLQLPLEQLYIENCGLGYLGLDAFSSLCKLKVLHIGGNSISSLPVNFLSCMTNLEEIKLNNMDLTSLSSDTLSHNSHLQVIDLSNNLLTTLPATIFDGLSKLKVLNLAGNPWSCDCNLMWLKGFLESMLASGGSIVSKDATYCSKKADSNTVTGLANYPFSGCGGSGQISRREKRTLLSGISPPNWATLCTLWQSDLLIPCGPNKAASCVYNFYNYNYSIVQFSGEESGIMSKATCRDLCQENSNSYFVYDIGGANCLCGDAVSISGCPECSASAATSSTLCNGSYSNVGVAVSVLYDLTVTISPTLPQVMNKVNFTLSGAASIYDTFNWNFGDTTTTSIQNSKSVSHIYVYAGQFEVTVNLTSSSSQKVLPVQVVERLTVVSNSDAGKLVCPSTVVTASKSLNVSAVFTSAWNQKVQWTRQHQNLNGQGYITESDKECEPLWTQFRGRCIQTFTTVSTIITAHLACTSKGARLLRFYSTEEIVELRSSFLIFQNGTGTHYYTGAELVTSLESYTWKNTTIKAFVFRETLLDASKGNCVAITSAGLQGVACNKQLPFVCEKDPVSCIGNQQSDGQTCYVVVFKSVTWEQAQSACQSTYTNGRLASILDSTQNAFVSGLLSSSWAWIGLRAWTASGHYTWQDGRILDGYTNWVERAGVEPCVSINSSGTWRPEVCDNLNSYACQYFVGGVVKIPWLVAGFVPMISDFISPVTGIVTTPPQVVTSLQVTLLLGSWVSTSGLIVRWNIQVESLAANTSLALQIWRPICSSGSLVRPGCSNNSSPLFTCANTQSICSANGACLNEEYLCMLTNTCLPIAKPCTCASISPISNINCQNLIINSNTFKLQLIYVTTIKVPTRISQIQFEPVAQVMVQAGDIIGFQSDSKEIAICEEASISSWRHSVLSASTDYWMSNKEIVDPRTYQLKHDMLCKINIVYTTKEVMLSPMALNYITGAGVYNFTLVTNSPSPKICSVTVMDEVRGLLWVYPEPTGQVSSRQGLQMLNANVEAGLPHAMTVKVLKGSDLSVTWFLNGGSGIMTPLSLNCSASITSLPDMCEFHSSLLVSPYSSLSQVFPSGSSLVVVNVTNDISWEAIQINIISYASITAVEFYHDNCVNRTSCAVIVEKGKAQKFYMKVKTGDMSTAVFYENGRVINPPPSDRAVLPRTFSSSGVYVLSVNVSNPMSWMIVNLTVHAQIRANFYNMSIDKALDKVAAGSLGTVSATVKVANGSCIVVTWSFNEESFQSYLLVNKTDLNLSYTYIFSMAGNVTVVLQLSDLFEDSTSSSMIIEVYKNIDFPVVLSTPSRYVVTQQNFNLTIRVDNCSLSGGDDCDMLIYIVDWNDESQGVTWRSSMRTQELKHQYQTPGNFTILVTVMSPYNSSNSHNETIIIEAQNVITGLNLTYDGPKHFSENLTFIAAQQSGSCVEYSIIFGDNITVTLFQANHIFIYKYSIADVYRATVTAKNAVSERTFTLTMYAYDKYLLKIIRIIAKNCVAVNKTVDISAEVASESPDTLNYDWNFGNGKGNSSKCASTDYNLIGIYTIFLTVRKNSSNFISDKKEICVEEEISGLFVLYDTITALKQPSALSHVFFHATVDVGSNLTYTWTVDDGKDIIQRETLNLTVTEARVFFVTVKVANNLNYQTKTVELLAIEIIIALNIHCNSCPSSFYAKTHANTTLEASVLYGTLVNYTWSFEDSFVTQTNKLVQHNFTSAKIYLVTVLAENAVSNESLVVSIIAQDEVTDVSLNSSLSVVEVNTSVIFQAAFSSGTSVHIQWSCDSLNVIGSNATSLNHTFTSAGYHQCSVTISNAVSSVTKPNQVAVLNQITDVLIKHGLKGKSGSVNLYAAVGFEYSFTPGINTDFLAVFEWRVQGTLLPFTVVRNSTLKYIFKSDGTYQIDLQAENYFSVKNTSITVEAQERISKVVIESNTTSSLHVFKGEIVLFRVTVGTGSNLTYSWTLNGPSQISRNDSVIVPFNTAGNFTVQVAVTNDLDTVVVYAQVFVHGRVSNVTIQIKQNLNLPFVSRGTILDLYSSTVSGTELIYLWTITHNLSGRQFMSDLMSVSFSFNLTGTYQVILAVKNVLSSEKDHLTLVVQGAITELKVTLQDSMVVTGSSLTFTGGTNLDATDVNYIWQLEGEIKLTSSFVKLFSVAGLYKVLITAANNVSSMSKENLVRVLDPITNLQIQNCQVTRVAQVLTSLQATCGSGTNITFTWYVEISRQNKTFTGQNISINFPYEGSYIIILIAHNDISIKTTSCQIQSQLPISHVTLTVSEPSPSYIFQNQNVTFTATGNNFQSAIFEWSIANYSLFTCNCNIYITSLSTSGSYILTLVVSNNVSQVQVLLDFTVKAFLCQLPDVLRVGAIERSVQRSRSLELEVAIDAKDCTTYLAVHKWTVVRNSDCPGDEEAEEKVDIGNTAISSPSIFISANVLDLGFYCVQFVTGYQYTSMSLSLYYAVNVTASKLKAIIKGGNRRTVAIGSKLHFDGSLSFDPDRLIGSTLIYKWICVEVNTTGGCFSNINNSTFYYNGFNAGKYSVTLQLDAPGRAADTTEQIIWVVDVPNFIPIASVVCESCLASGSFRVSSSQHVVLSATCENCQCKPAFMWKIFQGETEVFPSNSQTSTGLNKEHLVLNKWGVLRDYFNYTFLARVSCINSTDTFGNASLTLPANQPPSGGSCTFSPIKIIPLENQVTIKCSGWTDSDDPETLILYKIYVNTQDPITNQNQIYTLYSGTDETQSVYLSPFSGDSVNLIVMVGDEFGAIVLGGQSVITFNVTQSRNMTKTNYLMLMTDTFLPSFIKQATPVSLLQYAIALGQQLNVESQKEQEAQTAGKGTKSEQTRAAVRDAVTICLSTAVPISTLEDVQQMAFALRLLTDYSNEYLTEDSQRLLATTLQNINRVLQQKVSIGLDSNDVPIDDLLSTIRNLLSAVNARIYSVESVWESGRTITIDNFNTSFRDLRPEIAAIVGGLEFTDINLNETHRKYVVSAIVPLLERVLVSTLQTMISDEDSLELDIGGIKIRASRSYAKDIELYHVTKTAEISIPSTILSDKKDILDEVFQVMISHERNPYTYGYRITAWTQISVQTISFYETNGSYIQVANLADNARIELCMFSSLAHTNSCLSKETVSDSDIDTVMNVSYKNVTIAPLKSKVWQVPDVSYGAATGIGVHVQLRFSVLPTKKNATNSTTTGVSAYLGINYIPTSKQYSQRLTLTPALMAKGTDHRKNTFFQNIINTSDKLHIVATNDYNHNEIVLLVGVYFSSCEYFNTANQIWANNGCQAQEESTAVVTSCQCNHLTSFGGAGIISIVDIDFADLANLDILNNPVVFIALAIIFVIYILVAILCNYLDRLDLKRISKIPLCGQLGSFLYEVTVVTGCRYSAGTSANVGIKLYGSPYKGGARHLTKPGAFQRNCRDTFLMANNTNLGEITKILVWHDNTGLSPSWFLSHILVKDLQTESKFTFLVNSWLSLEKDDGTIQRTVKASDENELKKFYSRFSNIFHGLMADVHTWISVSNKPDHSRFTRVQRCTCCITFVYLYMSVNAMWYGFFKDPAEANAPLTWNFYGWEEIIIALISTLMVVPSMFGLMLIFKKSRCKASMFQEALRPGSAQTLEIDAMCTISGDGSYRIATPLGDWIPALDRESTTDSFNQVPAGLKRTVPMYRNRRKGSSDSTVSGKERPPISGTGSQRNFWNKDSIMKNWPNAVSHWHSNTKTQTEHSSTGPSGEGCSTVSKQYGRTFRNFHRSKPQSAEDSDEDLQQTLDEAEAEIAKDEEKRKKKLTLKVKQARGDGLFDSDDDWVNEGFTDDVEETNATSFNPRKEAELIPVETNAAIFNPRKEVEFIPNYGRKPSRTNFTLPDSISHKPSSVGDTKKGSSSLLQDGARPSIVSSSSKSKTILSGRLRSLSVVSQMSMQKNSGCMLPFWCVYVAYAVCAVLCLLSIILVLLYGYSFGSSVAIKWVVSLCITLVISIMIVEPLKVLVLAVYKTAHAEGIGEDNPDMIDIRPKIESNEQLKDVRIRPLGGFALLQAKEEGKKIQRLHTMMRDVLVFTVMFGLFLAIVYINYSSDSMYQTTNNIHSKFYSDLDKNPGSSRNLNITNLRSIPEFWQWTQTVLARSLHYEQLQPIENFGSLMGPAWLRQIRGEIVTCPAALNTALLSVPELVTRKCVDSGTSDPDTASYATGWTPGPANWSYFSSSQLNRFSKFGQSLLYLGGGYIQRLGLTYHDSLTTLQQLESEGWVDLQTRAVFIEFTLYSPSKDLTSCVTLVLEFPTSGGILASSTIWTEHLLRFIPSHVDPLMVCQIMFFPFILYMTLMVGSTMRSQKLIFVTNLWNWLDIFTCILLWANCGLYITCVVMATSTVKAYLADLTAPAQLEKVAMLHGVLRNVHACLVFLFMLKIVRQARFVRPFYKFYATLSTASAHLMGVFFIFIILLLTYVQFGYLLYGSAVYGYQSFQHSLMSLFGLMGTHTNFRPMFECSRVITHLFFISFGILVYGLVIALSVAVLTWSFRWSRSQMTYKTSLEARDYEMIEFMIKRFKILTGMQKQKPVFRHVKFEGLPSLSSRSTISNISHCSCNSPLPNNSGPGHVDIVQEYLEHCMANLQPAWEQVVKTVQKIEDLERQDEEKLQDLLNKIMKPRNSKLKLSNSRPLARKPLVGLKSPFSRFKSQIDGKELTLPPGHFNMSPPLDSTCDIPLDTFERLQFDNQKVRCDPTLNNDVLQNKIKLFRSCHRVSLSQTVNSSTVLKGNIASRFHDGSTDRLADSKRGVGNSFSKLGVSSFKDGSSKRKRGKKSNSHNTEV